MTHAYSDVLLVGGRPNQWVKYVNNDGNAAHVYVSTAVTTFQSATTGAGVYTFNPGPIGGIYTSYLIDGSLSATAPAAGDGRWAPSGITSHVVAYTVGDDAALNSATVSTSPYTPNAAAALGLSVLGNTVAKLVPSVFDAYATKGTEALPATSDSGNAWVTLNNGSSGAGLSIINGQLTNTAASGSASAGYAEINMGFPVARIGADITFTAGANTGSAALAIWKTALELSFPVIPDSPLHWSISPNQWVFGYWLGNVFNQLANYTFVTALTKDGVTAYRFECNIVGSTAYFIHPDGSVTSVTDSHIASIVGNFADWEVFQNNPSTETKAGFVNIWGEGGQVDRRAYATVGDAISALVQNAMQQIWLPVGALSVWTGQTNPVLASSSGNVEAWKYANAVDAYLQASLRLPPLWTGIKITFVWANDGAGAGNVVWHYMIGQHAVGAAPPAVGDHPSTVAAGALQIRVDTVMAAAQPVTSGALIVLRIRREGTNVADTLANAVVLYGVLIERANA